MSLTEQSLAWGGVHYSAHALWKRDGQSVNGRQECLTHYAPISLDDVPCASALSSELGRAGYTCESRPDVARTETTTKWEDGRTDHDVQYGVGFSVKAWRGSGELSFYVSGHGPTPERAATSSYLGRPFEARYVGPAIADGRGQMRRAEDAALTVYNEHPWARLASRISVDCATRGGRGGLTPKVATREFLPSVFAARQATVLAAVAPVAGPPPWDTPSVTCRPLSEPEITQAIELSA